MSFNTPIRKPFENIVGKGENAVNQHFLLFQQFFSTVLKTNFNTSVTFILSSANNFSMVKSKVLSFGNELMQSVKKNLTSPNFLLFVNILHMEKTILSHPPIQLTESKFWYHIYMMTLLVPCIIGSMQLSSFFQSKACLLCSRRMF